jgi:hypothetical protein
MIDRNHVTCKDFDYSTAGQIYPGYFFIPLRDGDGYYGWSKPQRHADNSHSAMFYLPFGQGKKPVQLPFSSEKLGRVSYSQFLDAYVFEYVPSRRNEDTVGKVWILSTSGDVTESTIPAGKWMRGSLTFVPARNGVIMSSTAAGFTSAEDPGHAGIYLVREDKVVRLLSGFPGVPAVSPNGCKVAVVVDPMTGPAPRATLQIVRLCDGGRNNGH